MRNATAALLALGGGLAALLASPAESFAPAASTARAVFPRASSLSASTASSADAPRDCGSATTVSGSPSARAKSIHPKKALSESTVLRLDGTPVSMSDLMNPTGVDLVILTRSFGWPFCQEQILHYADRIDELRSNDVRLSLVSIGTPEVGTELMGHLGIAGGDGWVYADPENGAYDRLELNRGWGTMVRPATAFRFRDRLFGGRGFGEEFGRLGEVLGKWKDAVYIPPKIEQSTNHGGTFLFHGDDVVFAHYDESPGTHYDANEAVELALREARK